MNPYLIPTIITIAFIICAGVGFLIGFFKGAIKGAVDIGVTVICAVLALPITKILSNVLFNEKLIQFLLEKGSTFLPTELSPYVTDVQALLQGEETGKTISEFLKMLLSLPMALILPIIFIIVFVALLIVAHIVAIVIESLVCPKTKNVWLKILGGALAGGASALIAITVLMPVVGYANLTVNSIEYFKETTKETEIIEGEPKRSELINNKAYGVMDTIIEYAEPIKDNFIFEAIYVCGGKGIFNILTTVEVSNVDVNLQSEVNGAVDMYDAVMVFVDDSPTSYGEAQIKAVDNINQYLERSELLPFLLSRAISFTAGEFYQGNDILGIEKPNLGEDINPTFDRILAVLATTDSDAIRKDFKTISDISCGAVHAGVIEKATAEEKDIWGIFENPQVIETILVPLYENERTRNMIPYLTGAVTNYAYKMYNDVNGTDLKPEEFDYGTYDEEHLRNESERIATSIKEIHTFVDSADFSGGASAKELILWADLGALGRGLTELRDGLFTKRLFTILLKSILESEAIDELGIVDKNLIDDAMKENANLEKMLVSRQDVLRLAIAIKDKEDKEKTTSLMESVIGSIIDGEGEALSTLITEQTLTALGMEKDEAGSIESIVNSLIDGVNNADISDAEQSDEAKKAQEIITAVTDTVFDENTTSMFDTSGEGLTAEDFVNDIMNSKLASSMVKSATKDESVTDPYQIQDKLSDSDKKAMSEALGSYQGENTDKDTLNAIANIFGVTIE